MNRRSIASRKMSRRASRDVLHRLLDDLPDEELPAVRRFLEFVRSLAGTADVPLDEMIEGDRVDAETDSRWLRYQADGEWLADGDVRAWLQSWGSEDEMDAPRMRERSPE